MRHSLLGGGKRLRPILLLWAYDAVAAKRRERPVDRNDAEAAACALEMLHTYSLIHDDLPAMDDDILRRGQPTCHVAFDEATAILAGDALQALGFGILARHGGTVAGPLVTRVAGAVGPRGMVGGQQHDLDAERTDVDAGAVRRIHLMKTGALIAVSLSGGALLGGAPAARVDRIHAAGLKLGLAFQGADDLLDVSASTEQMGKTAGKDEAAGKATWVRVEGVERARARTRRYGREALRDLERLYPDDPARERLLGLCAGLWERDR